MRIPLTTTALCRLTATLTGWERRQPCAPTEEDHAAKPELQNPRAVVVVTRVSNKLTGTDEADYEGRRIRADATYEGRRIRADADYEGRRIGADADYEGRTRIMKGVRGL